MTWWVGLRRRGRTESPPLHRANIERRGRSSAAPQSKRGEEKIHTLAQPARMGHPLHYKGEGTDTTQLILVAGEEGGRDRCWNSDLSSCRSWAGAAKLLPLQGDVGKQQGEGDASPHDGFIERTVGNLSQSGDAEDYAYFEKDDGDRKAAGHPSTRLLDFAVANERDGDASGEHPQERVGGGSGAEGTGAAQALLEILDVEAKGGGDEDTGDIEASDNAMELGEALAETV